MLGLYSRAVNNQERVFDVARTIDKKYLREKLDALDGNPLDHQNQPSSSKCH